MAHYTVTLESDKPIPEAAINMLRHHAIGVRDAHSLKMSEEIVAPSFTAKIRQDSDAENPRDNDDLADVMFCKHGHYTLGDKDAAEPFEEVEVASANGVDIVRRLRDDVALCIPLSLYDHSGITIFHGEPTCRWDSGQVGWHYITKEALQREWNGDLNAAKKYMEAVLEEYDHYLRGNVWGFEIENEEGETVDSCWGFIGDDLDKTGMLEHVATEHQQLIRDAWERRFG